MYYRNKKCNRKCNRISVWKFLQRENIRFFFSFLFLVPLSFAFLFPSNRAITVFSRTIWFSWADTFSRKIDRRRWKRRQHRSITVPSHAPHLGLIDFQWPSSVDENLLTTLSQFTTFIENQLSIICRREKKWSNLTN